MYIQRFIEEYLVQFFDSTFNRGLILSGVVGCGKTTAIRTFLKQRPENEYVAEFTCDDTVFRSAIGLDSKFLFRTLTSKTNKPIFLFVDEVQKSEDIFDSIKYAFDHLDLKFIVSGSNPDFLNTVAKKRLQRRADFFLMMPLALSEILASKGLIDIELVKTFGQLLLTKENPPPIPNVSLNGSIESIANDYFKFGGFPRAHLASSENEKIQEIKLVIERGFESVSKNNMNLADQIIMELASLHSKEFSYQGVFQRTQIRSRDLINFQIDQLMNHGYLFKKKPQILGKNRVSYISNYSWIDPGILTYLNGPFDDSSGELGFLIEGYVFSRLKFIAQLTPIKSQIEYYKPFHIDSGDKLKFSGGEIDFIFMIGKRWIPIEVKAQKEWAAINTKLIEEFIKEHKLPMGLVLYGGTPFFDKTKKILFWPYWAI